MKDEEKQTLYDISIKRSDVVGTFWIKGCTSIPNAINAYLDEYKASGLATTEFSTGLVYTRLPHVVVGWIDANGTFSPARHVTMRDHSIHATRLQHFDTPQQALASMIDDVMACMEATVERMQKEREHYTDEDFLNISDKWRDYAFIKDHISIVGADLLSPPDQRVVQEAVADRFYRQKPTDITVTLTRDEAERLSFGMSDLLCWCRGFRAAMHDDGDGREPIGVEETRDMSRRLKRAISEAKKERTP